MALLWPPNTGNKLRSSERSAGLDVASLQ